MAPTLVVSQAEVKALPVKKGTSTKKKGWKKPKDKPKRPLSAYNLFFQYERDLMLRNIASPFGHDHTEHHSTLGLPPSVRKDRSKRVRPPPHGKIGFAQLAKQIGARWKSLSAENRSHFQGLAAIEKNRYTIEVEEWQRKKDAKEAGVELPPPPVDGEGGPRNQAALSPRQQPSEWDSLHSVLNQACEISSHPMTQMPMSELPQVPSSMTMAATNYLYGEAPTTNFDDMPSDYCHAEPEVPTSSNMDFPPQPTTTHRWQETTKFPDPPKMCNNTHMHGDVFSLKSTLKQTESSCGITGGAGGVEDGDILEFLSRLVSD